MSLRIIAVDWASVCITDRAGAHPLALIFSRIALMLVDV